MKIALTLGHGEASITSSPIFWAAVLAFSGVFLTILTNTILNSKLATRRQTFEEQLANNKAQHDKDLADQKLKDEREARADARSRELRLRRIDFQRQNLLQLQEAMHELVDTARAFSYEISDTVPSGARRQRNYATNAIRADWAKKYNKAALYEMRSTDEELRSQANRIRSHCVAAIDAQDVKTSEAALDRAMRGYAKFTEDSGVAIRHLDKDE